MSLYTMTRSSIRGLLNGLCRPTVTGLENVPRTGPVIIASNHLSFLDSIIIQALTPRDVAFFAKAEYFTTPGLKGKAMKTFFESVGSIPVQRGEQAASVAALESLVDILEAGGGIGIYPEGTRSRDGKLYRGRTGVGWLALTTGAPVVPVGLIGTENLQPAGQEHRQAAPLHPRVRQAAAIRAPGPQAPAAAAPQGHRRDRRRHRRADGPGTGRRLQPDTHRRVNIAE